MGNPISHAVWTIKQCCPLRALSTQLALVFFISSFLSFSLGVRFIRQTSTMPSCAGQLSCSALAIHHPLLSLLRSLMPVGLHAGSHPLGYSPFAPLSALSPSQPTCRAKGPFSTGLPTAAEFSPVNSLCHSSSANTPPSPPRLACTCNKRRESGNPIALSMLFGDTCV